MIEVSIILVNYNTYDLVLNCVDSIERYTKKNTYEIIVVDNNSPNRDIEKLNKVYPNIKLILNENNSGFGAGNNLGFAQAEGEYVFLLNSDTIFCNDSLKYFVDFFRNNQDIKIGVVGSYLLDRSKKVNFSYGYFIPIFKDLISFLGIHLTKQQETDMITKKVDWVSGANMFFRTNVFENNQFDEMFFMYSEEVDLQLRLKKENYQNYIISGPEIIHLEGGSGTKKNNIIKQNIIDNSRFHFYKKHSNRFNFYIYKILYKIIFSIRIIILNDISFSDKIKYVKGLIFKK